MAVAFRREESLEFRLDQLVPPAPDFVEHERSFELLHDVIGNEEDCTVVELALPSAPSPPRSTWAYSAAIITDPIEVVDDVDEDADTQVIEVIELDMSVEDLTIDIDETITVPLPLYRHPSARKAARAAGVIALGAVWVSHVAAVASLVLT